MRNMETSSIDMTENEFMEDAFDCKDELQISFYDKIQKEINHQRKLKDRYVKNIWRDEDEYFKNKTLGCLPCIHSSRIINSVDFASMSAEEKKYRVKYLWFKVRTVHNMIKFINFLR